MKKAKIIVVILLYFFSTVKAQNINKIVPIKVGDVIPEKLWDVGMFIVNHPNGIETIKFKEYKRKLVILDFWATWCSSCLQHFPVADSLQNEFKNDVQILLVNAVSTKDTKEKVLNTLIRFNKPNNLKFSLPSIIQDTIFEQMFPHYSIPHYVWIDQAGIVRSITSAEELTRDNIVHFLKDRQFPKYQKDDYDHNRPLYTVDKLPLDHLQQFSMLLKGKIDGIGGGGMRLINDTARGVILHNRSLLSMYKSIASAKISGLSENRLLVEVKDPTKLSYNPSIQKRSDWERENDYSYELVVPESQMTHLFDYVLDDLNRYTAYNAQIEKRKMFCWILEKTDKGDLLHTKGGQSVDALSDDSNARLINSSLFNLCIYLNQLSDNKVILDETGINCNIDLEFMRGVKDMATIKKLLKPYGLKLYSKNKQVDMLIIKDK